MIRNFFRSVFHAVRRFVIGAFRLIFRQAQSWGPPLGTFSGLALLRERKIEGGVIFESQDLPSFPSTSVTSRCRMGQGGGQPWPLFWCHLGPTRLVGSSLSPCNHQKKIMEESAYGRAFYQTDPSFNYLRLPQAESLSGQWTSMACRWDRGYYHWLMDVLPRMACLGHFPADTRCLVRGPIQPFQSETLRWLGWEDRFIFTQHDHFLVEDFFYAGLAGMSGCVNPWKISFLKKHLGGMAKGMAGGPKDIYIIRRGKTRGIRNESEVEDFFRNEGWSVLDTEELTMAEQAGWFAQARRICSLHGAALTNLIWARPGTRVLELLADNFLNGVYEGMARTLDLDYSFQVYPGDRRCKIHVPLRDLQTWVGGLSG